MGKDLGRELLLQCSLKTKVLSAVPNMCMVAASLLALVTLLRYCLVAVQLASKLQDVTSQTHIHAS